MKYDDNEFDTDDYLDEEKENLDTKDKKTKNPKKSHRTKKKVIKKTKKSRPKQKVVYKYRDNKKSHSGILIFFLILIVLGLLAVIGYLVYINYYKTDEQSNNSNPNALEQTSKTCTAKASKYNVSAGLAKCSDSSNFKLIISGTDLSFDITRTGDELLPYLISKVYYDDNLISTPITGVKINENIKIKTKEDVIYLLLEKGSSKAMQSLVTILNGKVIYSGINNEYKLGTDITYIKYTDLGLKDIDSCDNYEANGTLDSKMWTKGKLIYKDGVVNEEESETITAKDVCTK